MPNTSGGGGSYMIDGRLVSGATPNDGDVITWVAANGCWEPHPASTIVPGVVNQDYYIDGVTGSDANTGLTKTVPLATIQGFFARYGTVTPVGSQRRVHLAGTGGADPWVTPTTQQVYGADVIDFGVSGAIGNSTVFRGPTNMILGVPTTGPATAALDALPGGCAICLETDVANPAGQRTRLNFVGAAPGWTVHDFSVYGQGYKLRITRAGAKVIFECPIADNGVNFIIVDTLGLVGVVQAADTFEVVYPAAAIRGATDYGAGVRFLNIHGQGAAIIAAAAMTSASMGHNFERLVLEDVIIYGENITLDRCCIIPGVAGLGLSVIGGSCHFTNSMGVQTSVNFSSGGRGYHLSPAASNTPRPDGVADPINQVITIGAMFNELMVGNGEDPGYFFADDNLSVYGSTSDGITCNGGGIFRQGADCLYLGGNANTGFAISCQNGAQVRVAAIGGGGTATEIAGAANPLRVDDHAGIAYGAGVGAFGEALGFNGLYHNTSLAAGVTSGRMSFISIN